MNSETMIGDPKKPSILLNFFNGLRREIDSPFNEWVTGEAVGHTPTKDEKLVHFLTHGGRDEYRKKFLSENPGALTSITE